MKRTRHTPESIICKLKMADQLIAQGKTGAEVCGVLEVAYPTYHRWRQLYCGLTVEEAKQLTQF
jgi:putative transposase